MNRTNFMKIFVLLVLSLILIGCGSKDKPTETTNETPTEDVVEDVVVEGDSAMSYFKKTSGDTSLTEGSYDQDDSGQYYFYIDNYSDDKFASLDIRVDEINTETAIYEETGLFIRPGFYYVDEISAQPGNYYTPNLEYYTLNGPAKFDYEYYYGSMADGTYVTQISKVGGFSEQELEQVAQQEYIIAVATNMYEYTYLFYDQAFDIEAGNSQFDETKALYKTVVDYDTKSISLYSLSDGQLKE